MRKNINKYFIAFCLAALSYFANAQTDSLTDQGQMDLMTGFNWVDDPHDRIIALNDLLNSGRITKPGYIAGIYQKLAESKAELNADLLSDCDMNDSMSVECQAAFDEIFALYDKAMKTCEFCSPVHLLSRYEFEDSYYSLEEKATEDLKALKKMGYKKDRVGIPLGITYTRTPKADYIGVELSLVSVLQPRYKIKNLDKESGKLKTMDQNLVPFNYQGLTCGFNQNITRPGHEIWFSLGQLTSPLMINPVKIGFTDNYVTGEKVHWFYRPGIGLGWGVFSVNCDYNLVFKKAFRRDDNKWFITARVVYPIFKAFD